MSHLVAEVPDFPVSVLLSLDMLGRLRKLAARGLFRRDARFRGVLFGRTDTIDGQRTLITVEACEPRDGLAPVGLVRGWVGGNLLLDQQDRDAIAAPAGQPYSILLVLRLPGVGVPIAGAFLCESGTVTSENSFVEFPLDRSRIAAGRFTVLDDRVPTGPRMGTTQLASKRGPIGMPRWAWLPMAVAMLALFGVLLRHGHPRSTSPNAREPVSQPRILLSLQRAGDDLLLRWDADHPAVRDADHAVLRISDGGARRGVPLDPSQLQVGAAQYHPLSNDVEFQLEISGANGAVSEPVRFISGPLKPGRGAPASSSELPGETAVSGESKGQSDRARGEIAHQARPPNPALLISYEPLAPSAIRKAVNKVRGVPLLRFRSGAFVAPRATHQVSPAVPLAIARQLPADQRVQLRANVDKNGRVTNVQLVSPGADKQLIAAAENAIRRWQFNPARLDNRPIASSVRFTVRIEKPVDANLVANRPAVATTRLR